MKQNNLRAAFNISLFLFLFTAHALPVAAQEPHPLKIAVDEAVRMCETGTIMCPARFPSCDDTSIATIRDGDKGPEIVGVSPGTTLCSVMSANGVRFVYSVTVR